MSKNEFDQALRNVDDDITKCEEFLCKVLDAKTRPLKFYKPEMANRQVPSKTTKSVRHLTPPIKLTKPTVPKRNDTEHKIAEFPKRLREKSAQARSASCSSDRSSKRPVPLPVPVIVPVPMPMPQVVEVPQINTTPVEDDIEVEEVTCRSTPSTHSLVRKQSWSELLKENQHTSLTKVHTGTFILSGGPFNDFDPVRTLHFLTLELQNKIYIIAPDETSVHRIVTEIQQCLLRLPYLPQSNTNPDVHNADIIAYMSLIQTGFVPPQLSDKIPVITVNRPCQTDISFETAQMLKKEHEFSRIKLELNCKNLNEACSEAMAENEDLKDAVKTLRNCNISLLAEVEQLKQKLHSSAMIPDQTQKLMEAEKIIEEQKLKIQTMQKEKEIIVKEYQYKIILLEDSINLIKKKNEVEYSTYMGVNLELEKKNTMLGTKDAQLDILKNELAMVQEMVRDRLSTDEENNKKEVVIKSKDRLSRIRDNCLTPTSSLSTLPESVMTRSPCRELKYNDKEKSSKPFKLSKNYDMDVKSSSQDFKLCQQDSRYNIMRRKYRNTSAIEQESKLTLPDSMNLDKITDTEAGGSQGDVASVVDIFQEIRQEVLQKPNVTLPSPLRKHQMPDISSSQSQWSDSM